MPQKTLNSGVPPLQYTHTLAPSNKLSSNPKVENIVLHLEENDILPYSETTLHTQSTLAFGQ